jgi:type II secretory pathway pseudopilin PulG
MIKSYRSGLALLELLFGIMIMAVLMKIALPSFQNLIPTYKEKLFLNRLNGLMQTAIQRAIKRRMLHKIVFDLDKRIISLEEVVDEKETKKPTKPIRESLLSAPCPIPDSIEVKQLFVEGFDEIARYMGNRKAARVWFFVLPNGSAQAVIINMMDASQEIANNPKVISLVLNPFSIQFDVYDDWQKP